MQAVWGFSELFSLHIWESDCLFAIETTLDVRAACLIGLNLNVFQAAPGAYGRLQPSRGRGGGNDDERK